MRLLIVSNMPHYRRSDGTIVGWGPTVQELDHLATRFERVRHIAPLHDCEPPAASLPYAGNRVELVPMRPTGGDELRDKLDVLAAMPGYARTMLRELRSADVVHLRCPANLPMICAALLPFVREPRARWIKYAGDWRPTRKSSLPFAFQRWLLEKQWHRGTVTVNGDWPDQPAHIRSFYNPSLTAEELMDARRRIAMKRLELPLRVLFVGRLEAEKGGELAVDSFATFIRRGGRATLDFVGDGAARASLVERVEALEIASLVTFHGFLPRPAIAEHYARAHVMLFPSVSEGWPKVLSEGMAYGAVPIASAVGAIPQYLERFRVGRAIAPHDPALFATAMEEYIEDPERWLAESTRGQAAADMFSYGHYLAAVDRLLAEMQVS